MLNTAIKAARQAGALISRSSLDLGKLTVHSKSDRDYVSEVDQLAEQTIIRILREAYPDHAILAEETGESGHSEYQWIIDPLDGTTNFLHGLPQYAVSVALKHKQQLFQAVVYDPARNELFTASRGGGAYLNDRRIRVASRTKLAETLIGTGFPFRDMVHADAYLAIFRELMAKTSGLRRPGSAALDLAWVACGRYDGFFEFGLNPWDQAAGALLVTEAGGMVGNLLGDDGYLESGNVVAANPKIFAQLVPLFAPHLTPPLRL